MGAARRVVCLGLGVVIGLQAATQFVAVRYHYDGALGAGLSIGSDATLYPFWAYLEWAKNWGHLASHKKTIALGLGPIMAGVGLGGLLIALFDEAASDTASTASGKRRTRGWGTLRTLTKVGFLTGRGVVFGRGSREHWADRWVTPHLLSSQDLRPMLVTGGTRSGKGRGIVVPSLLNWEGSTLVFDPKGELWQLSAGYRSSFGHVLFFNPRDPKTARFNPLAEISTGPEAIAQVQRLVSILVEPDGARGSLDFWERQGAEMLAALILHVLYAGKPGAKSLVTVKALSATLDATAQAMLATGHIKDASGRPLCHPLIGEVARAYEATHEKGRKSIQMTVRSYLSWIAGPDIEHALSASDFRLGDLMCARHPMSLYVQVAPADLKPLQPLVRLFFHMTATTFTSHIETDSDGRPKEHGLLLALDEFPLLGKISFFEDVVRLASGYGLKCLFIAQSLNDIGRVYGPQNGFIDNCHIYVAFSALDPVTQDKVSKLTGTICETRTSASLPKGFGRGAGSQTVSSVDRALMEPADIGSLPDDEELVFIAGHKPYRMAKLRYDRIFWMEARSKLLAPDQGRGVDAPERPAHPWDDVTPAHAASSPVLGFAGEGRTNEVVGAEAGKAAGGSHLESGYPSKPVAPPSHGSLRPRTMLKSRHWQSWAFGPRPMACDPRQGELNLGAPGHAMIGGDPKAANDTPPIPVDDADGTLTKIFEARS